MLGIRTVVLAILITSLGIHSGPQTCAALFSHTHLTTKEERDLGREFMRYVQKRFSLIEDPSIVNYVNKIGQRIVAQHPSPAFEFNFYVVKEDVYNAFAAPAGHVFIYSGLLAAMESEEELAGILAHEAAHVFGRHISKQMEQSKKIGLATMAGVLAGIFLGGSPAATGAITSGSIAAGQSLSLQYSREHEVQADQVGLKYLTKAGYGAEGLLKVLHKIREKQWFGSEQIPSYLTTHPAVEVRMAYLDTWIQAHPEWRRSTKAGNASDFDKVRAKLIAIYGDTTTAHNMFDVALRKNRKDAIGYYGKGLLLAREGKKEEGKENLRQAVRLRPLDADILRDLGKTYFHMGDYDNALKTLRGALAFDARDPEGRFLLGRAQMETGNLQEAVETFEMLIHEAPHYLPGLYYLGETYGKLGNLPEAHYHLGMYYKEKGRVKNARFHLNRALKFFAKDPVKKRNIQEALKDLPKRKESGREKSSLSHVQE
jgi:predicted Zn-dependent protease